MDYKHNDIETLRLIRAFVKIADPEKRREIVALTEKYACASLRRGQRPVPLLAHNVKVVAAGQTIGLGAAGFELFPRSADLSRRPVPYPRLLHKESPAPPRRGFRFGSAVCAVSGRCDDPRFTD
jgi:hypothetical protein